ncbi:MAG: PEP-CTERM sorting domain-containing protein [Opitutus sp.]|nr:PEP-CTERM sorting domain-containing protein [Opitutus sp.]
MKILHRSFFRREATALLMICGSLAAPRLGAQATTFLVNNLGGSNVGDNADVSAVGGLYNNNGATPANNLTVHTFANNFSIQTRLTGGTPTFVPASTNSFIFTGSISGSNIGAGTSMPVGYDFTLQKNAAVSGTVNWTLFVYDSTNTTLQSIATGSLTTAGAASQTFSGVGSNYNFTNGATTSATFSAKLQFSYTADSTSALLNVTMTQSPGLGITLNTSAIPEPSTYAAIAGAAMLGLAGWQRRRRTSAVTVAVESHP